MDNDTQPAGASAETSATPLSDALSGADRHQALERHETHREVGAATEPTPAPASPQGGAATPPAAAAPAAPAAGAPQAPPAGQAGEPDPASDPRAPKWYREHMAKVNRERDALRQENERLRTGRQPTPQPQPQQRQEPEIPDPLEDPAGYRAAMESQFESRQRQFELRQTLSFSERFARREHGNETFEECRAWLSTRPDLADYFVSQEDPWQSAIDHFKREKLAEEIGSDPNAWRESERARIRAELEAEMAGGGGAAPQSPARPSMTTPARSAPPPPASGARSSASGMDRDGNGRFTGPTPLRDALGKRRG